MSESSETKPDSGMPKGFKCECGKEHEFGAYVYAHWDIELFHTCDNCGARHEVFQGNVTLINDRNNRRGQ